MTSFRAEKYSRYARQLLLADPTLAGECLLAESHGWSREEMLAFLEQRESESSSADAGSLAMSLRLLRRRVMLRTMARDLAGAAPLDEVCKVMTILAEISLEFAQVALEYRLQAQFGVPTDASGAPIRMIVVGMGKLGGGELNVSSDIDLIFIYPEEGETTGGPRKISNHEFFGRLGRDLIALLAEPNAEGSVFRVDMRLRPWGDAGPLAMSIEALETYLVTQGREWERYAWIKARALTGDAHWELNAITQPFVYRKYLDFGAIAAMRELHAQVRAEVARRELADHIKLGPGGIREIEFIVQAFQLIRGGRDAQLRERSTLKILTSLAQKQFLEPAVADRLAKAYGFLRRLEHRLQYLDDAQTHSLPTNDIDRAAVSKAMGYRGWRAFLAALDRHRAFVSTHFEQVFSTRNEARHALLPVWQGSGDNEQLLTGHGFRDYAAVGALMRELRGGARFTVLPESSKLRYDTLIPRLIEASGARPNPEQTLTRCMALIDSISRRAAYLALLDEHPQALSRLAELAGGSPWAADYLQRHPVVLDELLDARVLQSASDWRAFSRQLRRLLAENDNDAERQMDVLREAHHAQIFRLLAKDLSGNLSVEHLADELSDLADAVLQVTLELCWMQLRNRHRQFPRFTIIGYGKLGGRELGYASDLDLVFLYDDPDDQAPEMYARLAQRLNNWLSLRTGAGVLFETDLRLRPDGASGLMVSSIEAFRRYQRESAWTWEHQALSRARFCAGDAAVGAAFEAERRHILGLKRDLASLRADILEMREKLLEGHPNTGGLFDIKHDRGGMIDIEFMVQYLVLGSSHRHIELQANDGNIALLGVAAVHKLIPKPESDKVRVAYRMFRRRQHALRLAGERYARVPREELAAHADATLALWKIVFA
ncbi:MAG: bifunctional [glutamate--ammonia ligase]-adenylyl-L-tyrosine phosphorylase/[glutamate--ammonia-ligase] adenylyltransferase [Betaproteobacteria bacterium]|nr:bifunctional [glutamate--ammonia ligase]-adenylyl-L-tyrosine phosphorylase/[glutamate--ammonia-ligase] adenylyltransferase [Betaproteobacteria bacterium]